ncbi:MAG: pilus assembly protein [Actinobacteria bacterium]|nr:pilus assembly protein [Actinomycetota bacterium]
MGRKTQRKIRERGAALVEAAFVMPIILLLTFGVWTVARAWQVHNTIDHAVREAARFGLHDRSLGSGDLPLRHPQRS